MIEVCKVLFDMENKLNVQYVVQYKHEKEWIEMMDSKQKNKLHS